ncbi:8761_t:CDS:2 [Cetraspora pellucida]|uniref:8761_t:CDS:1 n=1 Tax=Cetraspora pellucida TaxID=1433469 RepID=A0A9N9IAK0_9GLOM|nr:8761_t:CDS:2 [Cetraspora pellucida]
MTQEELAKWAKEKFGLDNAPNQATLLRILAKKNEKIWLTGKLICEKGCKLAEQIGLDPQDCNTPDFLFLFEQHYNFKMYKIHGESGFTDNKAIKKSLPELYANRHILLFIDGATSHAIGNVDLTHIKVVILPPRTTSRLQPMDASIIAAFKHRYHHFLLQHAIDQTITNCFHHTGLFDYKITTAIHEVHPNDENSSVLAELEESLQILSPCHPMSIAYYTNPPEETDIIHQEFTDADLLASITPENDNTDSINESNSSFITPSNSVRLNAIRTVISLLNTTISDHNTVLRTLCLLQ